MDLDSLAYPAQLFKKYRVSLWEPRLETSRGSQSDTLYYLSTLMWFSK